MDRSSTAVLISKTYTTDEIGIQTATETEKTVYCNIQNVGQREWFEAGRNGFKAELKLTMFSYDYSNESDVEVNGNRYSVYRTYVGSNDTIELFLEKKAGRNGS